MQCDKSRPTGCRTELAAQNLMELSFSLSAFVCRLGNKLEVEDINTCSCFKLLSSACAMFVLSSLVSKEVGVSLKAGCTATVAIESSWLPTELSRGREEVDEHNEELDDELEETGEQLELLPGKFC